MKLTELPTELLSIIVSHLGSDADCSTDLKSLRLSSRHMQHACNPRLFHVLQTDLSPVSLRELAYIIESENIAPHIRTIYICDHLIVKPTLSKATDAAAIRQRGVHLAGLPKHDALCEILLHLPRCHEVHIRPQTYTHISEGHWITDVDGCDYKKNLLSILLRAVGEGMRVRVLRVATSDSEYDGFTPPQELLNVHEDATEKEVQALWTNLQELSIWGGTGSGWTFANLCWILTHATHLQHLSYCPTLHMYSFNAASANAISCITSDRLETLELSWASVEVDDLLALLKRCSNTLRTVRFEWLQLPPTREGWGGILRYMSAHLSRLQEVAAHELYQGHRERVHWTSLPGMQSHPEFLERPRDAKGVLQKSWTVRYHPPSDNSMIIEVRPLQAHEDQPISVGKFKCCGPKIAEALNLLASHTRV
jgi:hypothetical protein